MSLIFDSENKYKRGKNWGFHIAAYGQSDFILLEDYFQPDGHLDKMFWTDLPWILEDILECGFINGYIKPYHFERIDEAIARTKRRFVK